MPEIKSLFLHFLNKLALLGGASKLILKKIIVKYHTLQIIISALILLSFPAIAEDVNQLTPHLNKQEPRDDKIVFSNNDFISIFENTTWYSFVLNNDYGLSDGVKSLTITKQPRFGSAEVMPNNTIKYVPNHLYLGLDEFEYKVCNIYNSCGTAKVYVEVLDYDYKPIAENDIINIYDEMRLTVDVLKNDLNIFDLPLSLSIITDFKNGKSIITSELQIQTVFSQNRTQTETLVYRICDADNDCAQAQLIVNFEKNVSNIRVPEGFSPESNGVNDTFKVPYLRDTPNVHITIVDKFGNLVYRNAQFIEWDGIGNIGSSNGKPLPTGVYYYLIKVNELNDNLSGFVYLSR